MRKILLLGLITTMMVIAHPLMAQVATASSSEKVTHADLVKYTETKNVYGFCEKYSMKCDTAGVRVYLSVIAEAGRKLYDATWTSDGECPANDPLRWIECYEGTPKQKLIWMENVFQNHDMFIDGVLTKNEAARMILATYD